jgi:hypothetical protein
MSNQFNKHPHKDDKSDDDGSIKLDFISAEIGTLDGRDNLQGGVIGQWGGKPPEEAFPEDIEVVKSDIAIFACHDGENDEHQKCNSKPSDSWRNEVSEVTHKFTRMAVVIDERWHELDGTPAEVAGECDCSGCIDGRKDEEQLRVV